MVDVCKCDHKDESEWGEYSETIAQFNVWSESRCSCRKLAVNILLVSCNSTSYMDEFGWVLFAKCKHRKDIIWSFSTAVDLSWRTLLVLFIWDSFHKQFKIFMQILTVQHFIAIYIPASVHNIACSDYAFHAYRLAHNCNSRSQRSRAHNLSDANPIFIHKSQANHMLTICYTHILYFASTYELLKNCRTWKIDSHAISPSRHNRFARDIDHDYCGYIIYRQRG